ncbi:MAG: DUF3604 domain-containing protein [Porticoccaceae bacterium]
MNNMLPVNKQTLWVISLGLALASCSDQKTQPSSEAFSTAADVHSDSRVIAETAEIDALLGSSELGILGGPTNLFATETELLERAVTVSGDTALTKENPGERNAYYGDLHVHTAYSFDGYAFGTLASPHDAYRFARGEAIKNPGGYEMQLTEPMDFYAVTDHGMFLGLAKAAAETDTEFSKNSFSEPYHDLNAPDNFGTDTLSRFKRMITFADFIPTAVSGIFEQKIDRQEVLDITRTAWADTIDAADQFNDPGRFTTFAGYEYTSSTTSMGNLHRNVIFQGTETLPREPFSRLHSNNPEDLWDWMDELRSKGVESLAIPHNSNGSNGQMFKTVDWSGTPFDNSYVEQRSRNEPIVEITQIKGTSETHPTLSTRDELAGFEITPYRVATGALSQLKGSYVREALLTGLTLEAQGSKNPYQFGFIGSSDTHSAASQNDESAFSSKLGILSSTAEQRGSIPQKGLRGQLAYYSTKLAETINPTPLGKSLYVKINGDVYAGGASPTYGASGFAAAWAEENTRESIYQAFRRKEVFATSGPRIRLRFFAGYEFDATMLTAADGIERAYANGVTMGGTLLAKQQTEDNTSSPGFLVIASADPKNAPLQRIQVVKGWVDSAGKTHERVMDVACANGAVVDAQTNRCPDNGARVDISDCSINPESGSAELAALWQDPDFDPAQRAFYYARAIENPTCRWSTWDAVRAGVAPRPDFATTLQERAWSSPIHYLARD